MAIEKSFIRNEPLKVIAGVKSSSPLNDFSIAITTGIKPMSFFYSITVEKTNQPDTLRALVYLHNDKEGRMSIADIGEGDNFRELMAIMLEANPAVTAVCERDGTVHFPDTITVSECAECIFWHIIKGA